MRLAEAGAVQGMEWVSRSMGRKGFSMADVGNTGEAGSLAR
jgi:hypothetical protein